MGATRLSRSCYIDAFQAEYRRGCATYASAPNSAVAGRNTGPGLLLRFGIEAWMGSACKSRWIIPFIKSNIELYRFRCTSWILPESPPDSTVAISESLFSARSCSGCTAGTRPSLGTPEGSAPFKLSLCRHYVGARGLHGTHDSMRRGCLRGEGAHRVRAAARRGVHIPCMCACL